MYTLQSVILKAVYYGRVKHLFILNIKCQVVLSLSKYFNNLKEKFSVSISREFTRFGFKHNNTAVLCGSNSIKM